MEILMTTKHNLTHADQVFVGGGYDAGVYGVNGRNGVPMQPITRISLGTPAVALADAIVDDATSTNLPGAAGTMTYTTATDGTAPLNKAGRPSTATIQTVDGLRLCWVFDTPRNLVSVVTHGSAVVAMTIVLTGYDLYRQKVVESHAITAGTNTRTVNGKKSLKYLYSVAITVAADASANTLNLGFGDVLGLPYRLTNVGDVLQTTLAGAVDAATVVKADATTATATTGDIRGTVDAAGLLDGAKEVAVYMAVLDPSTAVGLRGIAQYSA